MLFYFDESGDFNPPPIGIHGCSIVCSVLLPENIQDEVFTSYHSFSQKLPSQEKKNGEPKGYLLSDDSRRRFCNMINTHDKLFVIPVTLDLSWHRKEQKTEISSHMKKSIMDNSNLCVYPTMREQMAELARQFGNLSENQCLRLTALAKCFLESINHSVILHSGKEFWDCWNDITFIVDAVQNKSLTREVQVFEHMVLMWLCAWTKKYPIITINEIHSDDHPFVQNYCTSTGVDLVKLIDNHIRYGDSSKSPGLQIADICSNIIYQAVHDLNDYKGRISFFHQLMKNCPYGPKRGGPGLITVTGKGRRPTNKYSLIYRAMFDS